jgi:opacity protein-like surface antigen
MNHHPVLSTAAGALALSLSSFAAAQSDTGYGRWDDASAERPRSFIPLTSHGYVGANVGVSEYDLGGCAPGFDCDDTDIGFKVYTGGKFHRMFGVEVAYINLGQADRSGGHLSAEAVNLSLVGNLPVGERFNVYAKVGGLYGWTETSATAPGVSSGEEDDFNWSYGAGVQFDLNRNWALVADWDHYRLDYVDRNDDIQLWSAGVVYKF